MGKYIYIYYNDTEAETGSMEDWTNWFGKLGDKLVDSGNQFNSGAQVVHEGGVMPVKDMPATGYSLVNADNMEEALELAKGCPLVSHKSGAVAVYEAIAM